MKKIALALLTAVLLASSYIGVATSQSSSSQPAPGLMPRGTVALPGMYFAGDRDTGIYRHAADQIGLAVAGSLAGRFYSGGLILQNNANAVVWTDSGGSARRVAVVTTGNDVQLGDLDNALGAGSDTFLLGRDTIRFNVNTAEAARIATDGTLLVGTTTDSAFKLDVNGSIAHNGTQAYWFKGTTTFTSGSGTYNVPSGVRALVVRAAGGGGGGGYARAITTSGAKAAGGGGQAGDYFGITLTGLSASYAYAVGAAGAGGVGATSTAATAGGNTTFGASLTATGGGPGSSVEVSTAVYSFALPATSNAPAANAGSHINTAGGIGAPAWFADTAGNFYISSGGSNPVGTGADFGALVTSGNSVTGSAGSGCGAGGNAAGAWRSGANLTPNGGAGTAGCIIIDEYF